MAQNLIDALKERDIRFVVAPYEADAQVRTHLLLHPPPSLAIDPTRFTHTHTRTCHPTIHNYVCRPT